jgi:hypothetical protein
MPQSKLYRQKVLDKITSPEQLNGYIRVSNPRAWLLLTAVLVLLLAGTYWVCTGTLEISEKATAVTVEGTSYCWLSSDQVSGLEPNMPVRIGDEAGTITKVDDSLAKYDDIRKLIGAAGMRATGIAEDEKLYCVTMTVDGASNGAADVSIIKDRINPISFLLK